MSGQEGKPKILFIDIETAPSLATVWSIWNQNIGLSQLLASGYLLSWAAKWKGSKEMLFDATWKSGKEGVVQSAWKLLTEADIVVHYNGRRFDIPTLNKEFLLYKLAPPAPYKQVDLCLTAKKQFKLVSYKLAYLTKLLGMKGKIKVNHQLWLDVMAGKAEAQAKMEKYNKRDVTELEEVYNRLLPWIADHPNVGLYAPHPGIVCPNCGGKHIQARGFQRAKSCLYKRYQCQSCGRWLRSRFAEKREGDRQTLTQAVE